MREDLRFLKISSAILKVAAWIFLFLGLSSGLSLLLGRVPEYPRWLGIILAAAYAFVFFVLYIIAKVAELLIKIMDRLQD
jgi:hypothetical protein